MRAVFSEIIDLEMADFDPVPPPGELDETYASSLILVHRLHYGVIHKTK